MTEQPEIWTPDGAVPVGNAPAEGDVVVDGVIASEVDDPPTPSAALVPAGSQSTVLFDSTGPRDLIEQASTVATALSEMVAAQGLRVNMGTSDRPRWHLEVEAWQTLGTLLGCVPDLEFARPWVDPTTGEVERVKYTARVEHYRGRGNDRRIERVTTYDVDGYSWEARVRIVRNGVAVGVGEGLCSRKEVRWGRADDYAVKSMAITRATSRAYKQAAGWVVTLAGYSATPAAEVDPHTGDPLPFGPDMDGQTAARLRRAAGYLLDPAGTEPRDEAFDERIHDWLTAVHGETNGYLPQVVARAVLLLARDAKRIADPDATQQEA